ncbi:MAG: hypothetical protein Q8L49_04730 [Burkholderiaceae bacterium]|nr:hypothetical protein [Burkholderiaceae bacterium]
MQGNDHPHAPSGRNPFVPLLLPSRALTVWLGFQTLQLLRERGQFAAVRTAQEAQVEAATKLRASLDALASETQRFSDAGNPSARLLIDELRKRGITVNTPAAPAAAEAGKAPAR